MLTIYTNISHIKGIYNNETRAQVSMCFILHLVRTVQHDLCCYANRNAAKHNGSRFGRVVPTKTRGGSSEMRNPDGS